MLRNPERIKLGTKVWILVTIKGVPRTTISEVNFKGHVGRGAFSWGADNRCNLADAFRTRKEAAVACLRRHLKDLNAVRDGIVEMLNIIKD